MPSFCSVHVDINSPWDLGLQRYAESKTQPNLGQGFLYLQGSTNPSDESSSSPMHPDREAMNKVAHMNPIRKLIDDGHTVGF